MFEEFYDYRRGPCNPMADNMLIPDMEEYVYDEMKDSRYYAMLADKAPTQRAKDLLMQYSREEMTHAHNFMSALYMMTGQTYYPPAVEDPVVPEYEEALKERLMAETADYKKYGEKYLAACHPCLKNLFYMTRTVEAQHAMRIPLLMEEE